MLLLPANKKRVTREQRTIIKALCYADVFDYPLTQHELWRTLDTRVSHGRFVKALDELNKSKFIVLDTYIALQQRTALVSLRKKRERIAQKKHSVAQRGIKPLRLLPTIWFVGISGSLAVNNTEKNADIDLFIITAPHTLWTTRLMVNSLLHVYGNKRNVGQHEAEDALCINMWMDGAQLQLPKNERDLYTAHELIQLKTLINKHETHERLLSANSWVRTFLPNSRSFNKRFSKISSWGAPLFYETINRQLQLWYMAKHRSTETIGKHLLKFHPHDVRRDVLAEYAKRLRRFGIKSHSRY